MIKRIYLPIITLAIFVLTSCGSKMGELKSDYFTTNPEILEAIGGKVPVTINGRFPAKFFKKNAVVTVTPVLRWQGGQVKGQSATFQGEDVEANFKTVNYKNGGNFTMRTEFDYQPEMAKSELYLDFKVQLKGKTLQIPSVKVADGVLSTSELIKNTLRSANPATGEDAFQRVIEQKQEANIMFLIQQANLRSSELNSNTIKEFNQKMKEISNDEKNKVIDNIEVSAYASPDGGVSLNEKLAGQRENNASAYVKNQLKKDKIETYVDSKYTAQDWNGFQELVSKSNIQDKDLILRVLSMYDDPQQRETEIRNISSVYKELADAILPQLRRARLTLNYQLIGRSDDEILEAWNSNPKALSLEEMLYASTLVDSEKEKKEIFKKTTELYPEDYRAYNNLGEWAYRDGDYSTADTFFKKASQMNPNAPEVNTNLGLMSIMRGDNDAAVAYLSKGSGANSLEEAIGNLYVAQGQYERAVNEFGSTKTNSAALAQILTKDYEKAEKTLNGIKQKDAYTSYLKAILAARINDAASVNSNLKEAINLDPSLAKRASTDLEFAKYSNNSSFKSLVR